MARFIQHFISPLSEKEVVEGFFAFARKEGFEPHTEDGESCWKKGVGVATAPQFLKLSRGNGDYVLEAWIKFAVVPGVYAGEMDLNDFTGAIPKKKLKSRVNAYLKSVQAQVPVQK